MFAGDAQIKRKSKKVKKKAKKGSTDQSRTPQTLTVVQSHMQRSLYHTSNKDDVACNSTFKIYKVGKASLSMQFTTFARLKGVVTLHKSLVEQHLMGVGLFAKLPAFYMYINTILAFHGKVSEGENMTKTLQATKN